MKKKCFVFCMAVLALSCNNSEDAKDKPASDAAKMADSKMTTIPDMPFPLDHPYDNWQIGDPQHAQTVMKSLKAYTTGDIDACIAAFGDSVRIGFDNLQAKLSKDSLKTMFTQNRAMSGKDSVKMDDWESVISADKKNEWVTLWYKEYVTDKKGHTDSMGVVDDAKIENGKIVVLDQKTQKLGPAKKM